MRNLLSFLLLGVVLFQVNVLAEPAYLLNIDKLGRGYNIMKGNPDSISGKDGIDPGFRYPIFDLTVYEGVVTSDQRYKVPKGVDINSILNCNLNFDSSIVFGASSYSNSLRKKISADFSFWVASFKASRDFQEVTEGTNQEESVFTKSAAYCEVYQASIKRFLPPPLSEEFKMAVSMLDAPYDSNNPGIYLEFIDYFGTHYFNSVRLGGKFGQQSEIKNSSWTSLSRSSLNIEAAASASAFGASAAISVMSEEQKSMAKSFSKYTSRQSIYSIGSGIPPDGKAESWGVSCITDPQVVYYELGMISDLLKPQFFPQDSEIGVKKERLKTALGDYCNQLVKQGIVKDCGAPVDPERSRDEVFGGIYQVDDCGGNNLGNALTGGLFCPRGHTPVIFSRFRAPETKCGAQQYYCVDRSKIEHGSFGGMYQINDNGRGKYGNPECGGGYCCPNNKTPYAIERVIHAEELCGSNIYICLSAFVPGKSQIGGFYQLNDMGRANNNIFNPYTGSPSCPQGYKGIHTGRVKVPEGSKEGANVYMCILA